MEWKSSCHSKSIKSYLSIFLLGCCFLGNVRADTRGAVSGSPENSNRHRIIVYLIPDQVPDGAIGFADRLMQQDDSGAELRESMGFPITARASVNVPPLPDGRQATSEGPRARLARYLTLEYPAVVEYEHLLGELRRDERLGFVGDARGAAWSANPSDPHYYVPIGPPPDRQREYYLQLGFPSAWDYTKGHAIVGAGDLGIEVGHEDLLGNFRQHHSWDFFGNDSDPIAGTGRTLRGFSPPTPTTLSAWLRLVGIVASMWPKSGLPTVESRDSPGWRETVRRSST